MNTINYLTTIKFDFGAVRVLGEELDNLKIRRPLLITDAGIRSIGLDRRIIEGVPTGEFSVFDKTPANPTQSAVECATDIYRAEGCDGIIALGGGSSIDLAKAVAVLATHPAPLEQYAFLEGGLARVTDKVAPLIAIPTTAGTGSEVGRGALIIMQSGRKLSIISQHVIPKVAICDPELTLELPAKLTAATGMDALTHCMETFMSPLINPPADAIALDGLGRAARYIVEATVKPSSRVARWNMMMAAMEGAMAFQKGLGAVHALSHPLGALQSSPHHGTLNAILLPAVLRFNRLSVPEKLKRMGEVLGLDEGADLPNFVSMLNNQLGLPRGLGDLGIERRILPRIAELACQDHCHVTNPRVASIADYLEILEQSY